MWNNSHKTSTEHCQKISDFQKAGKPPRNWVGQKKKQKKKKRERERN